MVSPMMVAMAQCVLVYRLDVPPASETGVTMVTLVAGHETHHSTVPGLPQVILDGRVSFQELRRFPLA
eukprot:2318282-Pyramimonas_sp.AAC.1